jgi:hypothetical protein
MYWNTSSRKYSSSHWPFFVQIAHSGIPKKIFNWWIYFLHFVQYLRWELEYWMKDKKLFQVLYKKFVFYISVSSLNSDLSAGQTVNRKRTWNFFKKFEGYRPFRTNFFACLLSFTSCLNKAIFLVCCIRIVQDSTMCKAVVKRRVKHWLALSVENF